MSTWVLENASEMRMLMRCKPKPEMDERTFGVLWSGRAVRGDTKDTVDDWITKNGGKPRWRQVEEGNRREPSVGMVASRMGLEALYYGGGDNARRNSAKQEAMGRASGTVVLLAKSGHAYLAPEAAHTATVRRFLRQNPSNRFLAVLCDPFSLTWIKTYLNRFRSARRRHHGSAAGGSAVREARSGGRRSSGGQGGRSILQAYPDSEKMLLAFRGYYRQLRTEFRGRIQIKLTPFDPIATVLAMPQECFHEPYFEFDAEQRSEVKLHGFEMHLVERGKADAGEYAALMAGFQLTDQDQMSSSASHVDFFVRHSIELDAWRGHLERRVASAKAQIQEMLELTVVDREECGSLIACIDEMAREIRGLS